jgi:hypothetical protein
MARNKERSLHRFAHRDDNERPKAKQRSGRRFVAHQLCREDNYRRKAKTTDTGELRGRDASEGRDGAKNVTLTAEWQTGNKRVAEKDDDTAIGT